MPSGHWLSAVQRKEAEEYEDGPKKTDDRERFCGPPDEPPVFTTAVPADERTDERTEEPTEDRAEEPPEEAADVPEEEPPEDDPPEEAREDPAEETRDNAELPPDLCDPLDPAEDVPADVGGCGHRDSRYSTRS